MRKNCHKIASSEFRNFNQSNQGKAMEWRLENTAPAFKEVKEKKKKKLTSRTPKNPPISFSSKVCKTSDNTEDKNYYRLRN